jgi:hypothetical protein
MRTSNNVTEALQRTIVLMQGELERSVLATQILGVWTRAWCGTVTVTCYWSRRIDRDFTLGIDCSRCTV